MGKGYWHDVHNARDIMCMHECPFNLLEWHSYQELEFEYNLLKEENKKLKEELEAMKKKQRP